jgi:hypothetical protein
MNSPYRISIGKPAISIKLSIHCSSSDNLGIVLAPSVKALTDRFVLGVRVKVKRVWKFRIIQSNPTIVFGNIHLQLAPI